MDPRIRIHTKMSWIRNADFSTSVDVREYLESLAKSDKLRGEAADILKSIS
jgi:hypothetical protein